MGLKPPINDDREFKICEDYSPIYGPIYTIKHQNIEYPDIKKLTPERQKYYEAIFEKIKTLSFKDQIMAISLLAMNIKYEKETNKMNDKVYKIELTQEEMSKVMNALRVDMINFKEGGINHTSQKEIERYATGLLSYTKLLEKLSKAIAYMQGE